MIVDSTKQITSSQELIDKARETIHETSILGLLVVERPTFSDARGFFKETFRLNELEALLGREFKIVQQNHSRNETAGTLRGIHIAPWDKFIYVPRGLVQTVVVDLREDSPSFGKYESFVIGEERRAKIFVPKGCGNAYQVLSEEADYMYDTSAYWAPGLEKAIAFDDPDLAIKWLFKGEPTLSDKDKVNPKVRELFPGRF